MPIGKAARKCLAIDVVSIPDEVLRRALPTTCSVTCRAIHSAVGFQLAPKRDYLLFERTPLPREVQEDSPEQIEKLEHPAFIA
jgi:hypothetical protein